MKCQSNSSDPQSSDNPISESDLIESLSPSAMDQILIYLAFTAMRMGGHRHGTFLDAAATAAKCAIYTTYQEQEGNLRMTGMLHHIEPKRVKAIVQEIEAALYQGSFLKLLGSNEPHYLIQLPCLWLERYPWKPGESRLAGSSLTPTELAQLEAQCVPNLPAAQILNVFQFMDMIELLHNRNQESFPSSQRTPLSESLAEHIRRRLIHSGTVLPIENSRGLPFYVLAHSSYAPSGKQERGAVVIQDTARYFQLMRNWAQQSADHPQDTLRVLEELAIPSEKLPQALDELDQILRHWADRYHQEGGQEFAIHMVAGVLTDMNAASGQ